MVNIRGSGFLWKIQEFCGKIWENWKKKFFKCILESIYAYNPKLKTFQMKKNPPIHSRSPPTKMLVPRIKCFWTVYNYFRKSFKNHPNDQPTNDLPFKFRSDIDLCRREQNGSFVEGNSKKIKSKLLSFLNV